MTAANSPKFLKRRGDYTAYNAKNLCLRIDQYISDQLLQAKVPEVDFILLQNWTHNKSSVAPIILDREEYREDVNEFKFPLENPFFHDHVWLIAVMLGRDSHFERIDTFCMLTHY